jgi:hypothetical protein
VPGGRPRTQGGGARAAICAAEAIDDLYAPLERGVWTWPPSACRPRCTASGRACSRRASTSCSKPIALTLEDAEAIVAAAEAGTVSPCCA